MDKLNRKFLGNIRGPAGDSATVEVGGVRQLPPFSKPTVENSGTKSDVILNFGFPRPEEITAIKITESKQSGGTNEIAISLASGEKKNFHVMNGHGVDSMEQTEKSELDEGTNEFTFTTTGGLVERFRIRNGSKGSKGMKGDKGDKGDPGILVSAGSFFALEINEEGHLIFITNDDEITESPFFIDENGHLIYTIGE